MRMRQNSNSVHLLHLETNWQKRAGGEVFVIIEREGAHSLLICGRLDRRFSTKREAKSIYAARATCGHGFGGVPTTPRGRDLFLLVLFFG